MHELKQWRPFEVFKKHASSLLASTPICANQFAKSIYLDHHAN